MGKGANTRKKLIHDAFKLFAGNSYEKVSFSELEKASGVSRGSMVYYFKNKEGLFAEMLETLVFAKSSVQSVPAPYHTSLAAFYNYFIEMLEKDKLQQRELGIENMNQALFFIEMSALLNISNFRERAKEWYEVENKLWCSILEHAIDTKEIRCDIDIRNVADLFERTYLGGSFMGIFALHGADLSVMRTNFDQLYSLLASNGVK